MEKRTFHRFRSCRGLNTRQHHRAGDQRVWRADHRLRVIAPYTDRLDGAISADHVPDVRSVLIAYLRTSTRGEADDDVIATCPEGPGMGPFRRSIRKTLSLIPVSSAFRNTDAP